MGRRIRIAVKDGIRINIYVKRIDTGSSIRIGNLVRTGIGITKRERI